ncbi:MAG: hypothetical protein QOI88_3243 [Gammaproteobacteria bacterium]|jgi:hypothetical protein|nr:hypothetical protein [Gammaproteobacteria bacterium]
MAVALNRRGSDHAKDLMNDLHSMNRMHGSSTRRRAQWTYRRTERFGPERRSQP